MKVSISRSLILPVISSWGYILLAEAKENNNSQSPALGELSFHWCNVQQICGSGFNLLLMRTKIYVATECNQKLPVVKILNFSRAQIHNAHTKAYLKWFSAASFRNWHTHFSASFFSFTPCFFAHCCHLSQKHLDFTLQRFWLNS